jgi:Flp pilus assembly protein CpaB
MAGGGRKRGLILIVVAILIIMLVGAAAFVMRLGGLLSIGPKTQELPTQIPQQELVDIYVLAQPVARGTILTEQMVQTIKYPKSELVQGLFFTIDDKDKLIGQRTKYDLQQGIPLTSSLVAAGNVGSSASFQVPRGMVAISIPITRLTAVSYALQPGDHVNVIASLLLSDIDTQWQSKLPNVSVPVTAAGSSSTEGGGGVTTLSVTIGGSPTSMGRAEDSGFGSPIYVLPSETQRPRLISQNLVQDSVVLWVGTFPSENKTAGATTDQAAATPTPVPEGQAPEAALPPDMITIIVSPQDAVSLNYMMLAGARLNLVLRSPGDDQRIPTDAVTLQFILDQYNIPFPAKLPYGQDPRVDQMIYPYETPTAK